MAVLHSRRREGVGDSINGPEFCVSSVCNATVNKVGKLYIVMAHTAHRYSTNELVHASQEFAVSHSAIPISSVAALDR